MHRLFLMFFAVLVVLVPHAPKADDHSPPVRSISVVGEATTKLNPDQAIITVTPQTESSDLKTAKKKNDEKITKLLAKAAEFGIAKEDMQTAYTNVQPLYDYIQNAPPRLRGYEASASIMFTLKDLDKLAGFMEAVVDEVGIDRMGGIQFGLRDDQAAREETMLKALSNASSKAKRMAQTLGVSLAGVLQASESGAVMPTPPMPYMRRDMAMMKAASAEAAPDLPSGLIEIHQTVNVTYELK